MEELVGYVLFTGVLLSVLLIAGGVGWHWLRTGQWDLHYPIIGTSFVQFIAGLLRQSADLRPRVVANCGFAVLLLTPYARVVISMLYFGAAERNVKYTLFTAFVTGVLTYSLLLR